MAEDLFQIREKEIFETLKKLRDQKFVLIGGYAVNAYTFPRFSVDCDIVVYQEDFPAAEKMLKGMGYKESQETSEMPYHGKFTRFEKEIKQNFNVSIDILIQEVKDRKTGAVFSADWVFGNSQIRNLRGKTITEELKIRIINPDALFATKMLACRTADIRDMFLLVSEIKDKNWIKREVSSRYNFKEKFETIKKEITSRQFKDGLQGVFGFVDEKIFQKHKNLILSFEK
jgi:hypothetical protein